MYNLIKNFINLFLFKTKPEDILYSKVLLVFLAGIDFIVNYQANVVNIKIFNLINKKHIILSTPTIGQSLIILFVLFLILCGIIYSLLAFYHKSNRFILILTSLVVVDIAFRMFISIAIVGLGYSSLLAVILFIPLLYWEFVLYIFIFSNGFDFNYLKAGSFTLCYMLIQHNVGELLVNYICN